MRKIALAFRNSVRLISYCFILLVIFSRYAWLQAETPAKSEASDSTKTATSVAIGTPRSVEDLLSLEQQLLKFRQRMIDATVCVTVGNAQGSGVIVSEDGYVMTAAHVIGRPGLRALITFADGTTTNAETLGVDGETDAGMLRIVEKGDWTYSEIADPESIELGEWCVAVGHPGGWRRDRPPVVRLGRVITKKPTMVQSDCTLVGGDSGGPLYDLEGKIIGINSRIGASTAWNFHVSIATFRKDWEKLRSPAGFLGVGGEPRDLDSCILTTVKSDGPAARAGIREGDKLRKFDGKKVRNFIELVEIVAHYRPDQVVKVEVERAGETIVFEVTLSRKNPFAT